MTQPCIKTLAAICLQQQKGKPINEAAAVCKLPIEALKEVKEGVGIPNLLLV